MRTIQKLLTLLPYKITVLQSLQLHDPLARLNLSNWYPQAVGIFKSEVYWTDPYIEEIIHLEVLCISRENYNVWARICSEGVGNVSMPVGNIFTISYNVGKWASLCDNYNTAVQNCLPCCCNLLPMLTDFERQQLMLCSYVVERLCHDIAAEKIPLFLNTVS